MLSFGKSAGQISTCGPELSPVVCNSPASFMPVPEFTCLPVAIVVAATLTPIPIRVAMTGCFSTNWAVGEIAPCTISRNLSSNPCFWIRAAPADVAGASLIGRVVSGAREGPLVLMTGLSPHGLGPDFNSSVVGVFAIGEVSLMVLRGRGQPFSKGIVLRVAGS